MRYRLQLFRYITLDILGSATAWFLFNIYRKEVIEKQIFGEYVHFEITPKLVISLFVIPVFWVFIYYINSLYKDIFRRSRLKELGASVWSVFIGVLIIFFAFILDDYVASYKDYYHLFAVLFILQFFLTYFPRLLVTSRTIRKIRKRQISFPTLIVGEGEKALELFNQIEMQSKSFGHRIIGFISTGHNKEKSVEGILPCLGDFLNLKQIIHEQGVQEVLLAIESKESGVVKQIVSELFGLNVEVKAIPSMYDYLAGRVKMTSIIGTPLINVSFELMPIWQQKVKFFLDLTISSLALIILSPLILSLSIIIKITSKGPILYSQERVGRYGKPFQIFKFRSMYVNAEADGPALSSKNDSRITPIGRFLRKTRLDELPNFWNVIKGDMSLVGPRPERQFYIDQIVKKAPYYLHLQKVKPGITSWGQVKYGYAENVDQMVERLKYDLLYLENMSLFVDLKIIIYTVITVFRGRGV
ncbi:MAG: sugar transferase [Bacteroidales bacterium]